MNPPPIPDRERLALLAEAERIRRERLAAERVVPTEDPREAEEIMAGLLARRKASEEFETAFRASLATDPPTQRCSKHGTPMPIDIEASILRSWQHMVDTGVRQRRLVFVVCPACAEAVREADIREQMVRAGVKREHSGCTLGNWTPRNEVDRKSFDVVYRFATEIRRGIVALIAPGYGNGKTHLAVGIMREIGVGVFVTQSQFLDGLRETYQRGSKAQYLRRFKRARCLIIDEVGLSVGGKDELPALHDVLDYRHDSKSPTIITGNFSRPEQLESVVGPRVFDRWSESVFAVVVLTAPSERASRRDLYFAGD